MLIETLSTFPDMYTSVMGASIMKRAQSKGILDFHAYDLRDWTHDKHRTTDDEPYGGGNGLVMKCGPIFDAVEAISAGKVSIAPNTVVLSDCSPNGALNELPSLGLARPYIVFLAPQGRPLNDALADELSQHERILFVCGHYEGIDERAYSLANDVISLGDYVLTSGELASMVVIDAVVRKLPGVLGAEGGAAEESFVEGLLEYPQYTRPASYKGMDVPEVLLSGNHQAVDEWRRQESLRRTAELRPDLLKHAPLTDEDLRFLQTLPFRKL